MLSLKLQQTRITVSISLLLLIFVYSQSIFAKNTGGHGMGGLTALPIQQFTADGKMGFYQKGKGGSVTFSWHQNLRDFHIRLAGPFSAKSFILSGHSGAVILK